MDRNGYVQPTSFELALGEGAVVERAIAFAPGGRIRVVFAGAPEDETWVPCDLTDALGREVPTRFTFCERGENTISSGTVVGHLCASHPSETWPSIAPGEYRLEVRVPDREPQRFDVRVLPGRTAVVELDY